MNLSDRLNKRRERNPKKIEPDKIAMNAILAKLSEPSTIRGIISLLGAFGITINPELLPHITAAVLAAVGIVNVVRKEKK